MMQSKIQTQNEKKVSQPINEGNLLEQISTALDNYLEKVQAHTPESKYDSKVIMTNIESTINVLEQLKKYDVILKKIKNLISQIQHLYKDADSIFRKHLINAVGEGETYVTNKHKVTISKPKSGFKLAITDRTVAFNWIMIHPELKEAILDYKPTINVAKAKKYLLTKMEKKPGSTDLILKVTGEIIRDTSKYGYKITNYLPNIRIDDINLEETENNQSIID